jgi:hypothetical protein
MNALIQLLLAGPLKGKRTYVVGLMMVLNGLYAYFMGELPATFDGPSTAGAVSDTEAIRMVLEGLGLNTLRAGVGVVNGK